MVNITHAPNGRAQISVDRNGRDTHKTPNVVDVVLWYNLGYVQFGSNNKFIPERRLVSVGDWTSAIVGDYRITVERITVTTNKIIKLRSGT